MPCQVRLEHIHEALGGIFRRHGAVGLTLPPLRLKDAAPPPEDASAYVLDRGGHLLRLHQGGRQPLCAYLGARAQPPDSTFKRFSLGPGYRSQAPSEVAPIEVPLWTYTRSFIIFRRCYTRFS